METGTLPCFKSDESNSIMICLQPL